MRKLWIILGLTILIGILIFGGCAKRKNPIIPLPAEGSYRTFLNAPFGWVGNTALAGNKLGLTDASGKKTIHAYLPPGHPEVDTAVSSSQRYPVLYLLTDFNQNSLEFGKFYQIEKIANEMISSGQMDSLIIVVIGGDMQAADVNLGGVFYGNNFLVGDWITFITQQLIPHLDTFYLNLKIDRNRRAIAGLGMGGYGALRIALQYPGMFDVIGAMSAPLSFGGTDPAGWLESYLRPAVMGENGNNYSAIQVSDPFDPSKPATSWMFAMAAAFSPRADTTDSSGTTWHRIPGTNYGVDSPFDGSALVPSVVAQWMGWDIENLLGTTYSGALTGKKVYLDCGDADEFDFDAQNRSLDTYLTNQGVSHVYFEYSGYGGHDAMHGDFTYDRLQELFKYISANM